MEEANAVKVSLSVRELVEFIMRDGDINAGVDIGGHVLINQNGSGRTILQGKADNTEILAFGKSNVELNIETNNVEVSAYDDANIVLAGSYKSRTVNQGKGAKVLFR